MSDNIKVVVKVRPLISREIEEKLSYQWRVKNDTLYQLDHNGKEFGANFTFDKVYDKDTKTKDVYNDIAKPIVQAATEGFNGTIFAYGQTSSGKTYTMTGTDDAPGIIPLAVVNLFEIIRKVPDRDFLVRVSYLEIYNETIRDLLNVENNNVKLKETYQGIKMDVTEKVTSSPEEVLKAMKEGETNRQKGATNMNELSSRSHSIFQIIIESREHTENEEEEGIVNVSVLNLVDLAGSERSGQTGATGKRFIEGTHINKSLSSLALVIKLLAEDPNKFVNYRDSKLTRILQNSLGGNAKTSIICAVTPAAVEETISTLQFANRAKAIKNKPKVNEVANDKTMIQKLTKQMSTLQAQLESKKNLEENNMNLQKQITNLQKLILNGFNQPRSIELMSGARKKLQLPRRMTISTVHSIREEDPVVTMPVFCTPSLKYNPTLIPTPITKDFVPLDRLSTTKLDSVPEERSITPPRSVHFSDEVIELDSDDDFTQDDVKTCSPIHKCHDSSKTPPCILRRNAKEAEKNLKDIVELTEREKMYSPKVVELIEKLDQYMTIITQLKDDIDVLNKQGEAKDIKMGLLKEKIEKNKSDMTALISDNAELKTQCSKLSTQLTDSEVSYETLLRKAKLREEELISRLDEQKTSKPENIDSKPFPRPLDKEINFMDMSKDISLVNSDNENSIIANDEQFNKILVDAQKHSIKDQSIIDLQGEIFDHKQTISTLENCITELQGKVTICNEALTNMETENSLLKTTIETLNTTITSQKVNLDKAHSDIESYNSVIQELHIKLNQKDNLPKVNINDSLLENMITTEDKFIANNDNMKNIIHGFKNALDVRNKEIDKLKTTVKESDEINIQNEELSKQLSLKSQQYEELNTKLDDLNKVINENITTINKLMHENSSLKTVKHELAQKNVCFEAKITELEDVKCKLAIAIENENLKEKEMLTVNKDLENQIELLQTKINLLETEDRRKDNLISQLQEGDKESKDGLLKAKAALVKLHTILGTLSGNMQEVPEIIDSFVNIFNILSINLDNLENITNEIVSQRDQVVERNKELKSQLEDQIDKYDTKVLKLQEQIEVLNSNYNKKYVEENTLLLEKNNEYENIVQDKNNTILELNNQLKRLTEEKESYQDMYDQMVKVKENISAELSQKLLELENYTKTTEELMLLKENTISELIKKVELLEQQEDNKSEQSYIEEVKNIYNRVIGITNRLKISVSQDLYDDIEKNYEQIFLILDTIEQHVSSFTSKNDDSVVVKENNVLKCSLKNIQTENKSLKEDLLRGEDILKNLELELKTKMSDLANMENQVKDWKDQFTNLNFVMNEQINELKLENEDFKNQIEYLKRMSGQAIVDSNISLYNTLRDVDKETYDISPPSLLTICCNKISDCLQPKEIDSRTTTIYSNDNIPIDQLVLRNQVESTATDIVSSEVISNDERKYEILCKCKELYLELEMVKEENYKIASLLEQMEIINKNLIEDQEAVRNELRLLVEPANELQKKISNHKTNLSILTATTFAENRSLQSQVKVLQHYHKRFHNVCEGDIPNFKKQLRELMVLLKGDLHLSDSQSSYYKRYSLPDVLDSSSAVSNFRNESTLDGDLLMLDTNVTLATTADLTLIGDETCLDMTKHYNEAECQTSDLNETAQTDIQTIKVIMQEEKNKLRELVETMSEDTFQKKLDHSVLECAKCSILSELQNNHEKLKEEINLLVQDLKDTKTQKSDIEQKYNKIILERPSTDSLAEKMNKLDKDYEHKVQEVTKLNNVLVAKNRELRELQDENDTLSNQVMDHISEVDNLNKELSDLGEKYNDLLSKYNDSEQSIKNLDNNISKQESCMQCLEKDELIRKLEAIKSHTKLNRSLSDSDTSSRHNKICTLQSELHAGREDCQKLTEDVITIKNHLDRSHISMELDIEIDDDEVINKSLVNTTPQTCSMPDIPEESCTDVYTLDKIDCFKYYLEKINPEENMFKPNIKIIDIMKMLYDNLISKHGNQVENLANKLQDCMESKAQLELQLNNLNTTYSDVVKELQRKELSTILANLSQIKNNITILTGILDGSSSIMSNSDIFALFNDKVLKLIDSDLDIPSSQLFESIVKDICSKHNKELTDMKNKFTKIEMQFNDATIEINSLNDKLANCKSQVNTLESECNLLKRQKEMIQEISNAVTMDIVKKEEELKRTIEESYKKLIELNVVSIKDVDLKVSSSENINYLIDNVINQHKAPNIEKELLIKEVDSLKQIAEDKTKELELFKDVNNKLATLESLHQELNRKYESKVTESEEKSKVIDNLSQEIHSLKSTLASKERIITQIREVTNNNNTKVEELLENIKQLKHETENLKAVNEIITKEKETYASELTKSSETIKKNNIDLEKMTSDILVLRESVRENGTVIENLNAEMKSLLIQNKELKEQFGEAQKASSRLEMNIKIHENTAKVQTRMIMRLQTQKAEDDKILSEKVQQFEEINQKYLALEKEFETKIAENKKLTEDLDELRKIKAALESRISESDTDNFKPRFSIDVTNESLRHRRRSLHDSKRMFAEDKLGFADHSQAEAVFDSRAKPDDLFMDVDEDVSNRSTPIRLSKGRTSLSRTDESEDDSRPSSVLASRRRRQSVHDLQRTVLRHTPSPHGTQIRGIEELHSQKTADISGGSDSELSQLKKQLSACLLELEDLKEKYRELDDECETCAEYLRERDEQCSRLKKEKAALQASIVELKEKLLSNTSGVEKTSKPNVADAAINTDEDWTNLHSVVVDRMSYDAEVEKNKKLTKTIEELRFKKLDLKNTLAKMQKALDRHAGNKELEATKSELQSCKQELLQLKQKYKELDEECDTCSQYLREKEAQCRRLIEAKAKLEAKLEDLQSEGATKSQSTRKKRQSFHDQNRTQAADLNDATTETSDDFLSYQVERDGSSRQHEDTQAKEVKHLKSMVDKLCQQKAMLEKQLKSMPSVQTPAMYVATGSAIVQNQQLTDVMKENQKLKKINTKLMHMCQKRGKESNRENEDPKQVGTN